MPCFGSSVYHPQPIISRPPHFDKFQGAAAPGLSICATKEKYYSENQVISGCCFFGNFAFIPPSFALDATRWGLLEGAIWRLGKGIYAVGASFSPDGQTLKTSQHEDPIMRLWDVATGRLLETIPKEAAAFSLQYKQVSAKFSYDTHVVFSPDRKIYATGGSYGDPFVRLWNLESGEQLNSFLGAVTWVGKMAYASGIWKLKFSSDGQTLAVYGGDGNLRFFDVDTIMLQGLPSREP